MSPHREFPPRSAGSRSQRWAMARRLWLEPLESRRLLTTFKVTTDIDIVDAEDGVMSLREAVALANGNDSRDTITFDSSLAGRPTLLLLGQMEIAGPLTIRGLGA